MPPRSSWNVVGMQICAVVAVGFIFCSTFAWVISAQTQSSQVIDATVQVSVCGNGEVEGGEQCDGGNLAGKSCMSLQYESGTLSCSKSCDFYLSDCVPFVNFAGEILIPAVGRTLAPTPTPTSTRVSMPAVSVATSSTLHDGVSVGNDLRVIDEEALLNTTTSTQLNRLSPSISAEKPQATELQLASIFALLDIDMVTSSNQIDEKYLPKLVHNWTDSWRKTTTLARFTTPTEVQSQLSRCDVNRDEVCTVEDLSILLFYVSANSGT